MITTERQSLLSGAIESSQTRPALLQAMSQVARQFDFDHVTIMTAPAANDLLLAPLVHESTIPAQFVREIDRNLFLRDCPVLRRTDASILPQHWRLHPDGPHETYDCPAGMHEMMTRYGLLMGVVFPMNSVDSTRFFVRYEGKRQALSQLETNELWMISIHAFDGFDRMRRAGMTTTTTLSARELEVLRWTSQGKTSIEIGRILSLSDHTVNAYMTNAIKKLDCVNRTQLVAKAIRLKLIN
jgi:DNA-binding CsgD family transcriptional regulator